MTAAVGVGPEEACGLRTRLPLLGDDTFKDEVLRKVDQACQETVFRLVTEIRTCLEYVSAVFGSTPVHHVAFVGGGREVPPALPARRQRPGPARPRGRPDRPADAGKTARRVPRAGRVRRARLGDRRRTRRPGGPGCCNGGGGAGNRAPSGVTGLTGTGVTVADPQLDDLAQAWSSRSTAGRTAFSRST